MLTQRNTLYLSIDIVDKIIKESYDMETALNLVLYIKLWYRKVKKNAVITAFSKLNSSLLYIASPLEGNRTPILRTGILRVIHYTTRG